MSSPHAKKSRAQRRARKQAPTTATQAARSGHADGSQGTPGAPGTASAQRRESRREAAVRKEQRKKQQRLIIGGVVAAIVVALVLILVNRPSGNAGQVDYDGIQIAQAPISVTAATPSPDGPRNFVGTTVGNPDAPVTFIVYSDFQCHFCQQFAVETYPRIVDDFVRDGLVKVEFREFAALGGSDYADPGNGSARAAHGAMCAAEQDSYVEYHEVLFGNFSADGSTYTPNRLRDVADEVGLDRGQFDECMESNRYIPALEQSMAEGQALGITATPMFVIDNGNGQPSVTQMTTSGYDLLKKQIQAAIDTAP